MKFRFVFWDVLPCTIIVDRRFRLIALMMEAARTSETSVDNYFTRQYIPEDKSELHVADLIDNFIFLYIYSTLRFLQSSQNA
jgi:hypothetical protein